jgi:hypothetical protein
MIPYGLPLLAVGGARTGLPPVHLLDVQDVNGNQYFWADRTINALSELTGIAESYLPWLLSAGPFASHRSMASDSGSFKVQNVSGTTLSRDLAAKLTASAIEGAMFIYRCWQADAQAAWILRMGTLTFSGGTPDTATFKTKPLSSPAQKDAPVEQYSETCQLQWGGPRCGSTQSTECNYSFQSCQVPERPMLILNHYEKNYGETVANTPLVTINRSRRF